MMNDTTGAENVESLNLKDYGPLPMGGIRLLLWFVWQFLNFYFIRSVGWRDITSSTGFTAVLTFMLYLSATIFIYIMSGGLLLHINEKVEPWKEPFRFISHYWKRNVVGYSRYIEKADGKIYRGIHYNKKSIADSFSKHFNTRIFLPLGGWWIFRQAPQVWADGIRQGHLKLQLADSATTLLNDPRIYLTDSSKSTIYDYLDNVLVFLNRKSYLNPSLTVAEIGMFSSELFHNVRRADTLNIHQRVLADAVVAARDAIASTTRFGKSKDAKKIRENLNEALKSVEDPRWKDSHYRGLTVSM